MCRLPDTINVDGIFVLTMHSTYCAARSCSGDYSDRDILWKWNGKLASGRSTFNIVSDSLLSNDGSQQSKMILQPRHRVKCRRPKAELRQMAEDGTVRIQNLYKDSMNIAWPAELWWS